MNTATNKANHEKIIPAEEAWRYDEMERDAMIHNGFIFEKLATAPAPETAGDKTIQKNISEATQVFHDAAGNIISAERAEELRFVFQNIDANTKMNGLGEKFPRLRF